MKDPLVRTCHLLAILGISHNTLSQRMNAGHIPKPDARGQGNVKLWKMSTIRAWNPAIAADVEALLALPTFAPRPQRRCNTPLLAA